MNKISSLLVTKMLQHNIIDPIKKNIYITGIELILADIINFSLILIIGIIVNKISYSIIYLLMFWTVRRFSGGFHAKTYAVCRITFISIYLLIIFVGNTINSHIIPYVITFNIISIVTMFLFAPISHPNKKLTDKEKHINKILALITTLIFIIVSILLVMCGHKIGLIISLILLAITILMYVGMFTNKKGVKKQCLN